MKPIIFSTDMVRAILDGRKTQTRRIVKIPKWIKPPYQRDDFHTAKNPYQVGDILWVREAVYLDPKPYIGRYKADDKLVGGDMPLVWCWITTHLSGRYMPKTAARIFLEVTKIRVEGVQDITPDDIMAEGRSSSLSDDEDYSAGYEWFAELWNSIHGKDAWDRNEWVWVYDFEVSKDTEMAG